jgi:hypothetical protein
VACWGVTLLALHPAQRTQPRTNTSFAVCVGTQFSKIRAVQTQPCSALSALVNPASSDFAVPFDVFETYLSGHLAAVDADGCTACLLKVAAALHQHSHALANLHRSDNSNAVIKSCRVMLLSSGAE